MSWYFGVDDPGIERTLSVLLGNHFGTDERQRVVNIDFSDFDGSSNLHILLTRILPQLAKLTHLQELNLSGCNELDPYYLPPEIGNLCHIATLKLSEFHKLKSLPKEIGDLKCLKQLILVGCGNLSLLPVEVGKLTELEDLVIGHCVSFTGLPAEIGGLSNLKRLNLSYCWKLKSLPAEIGNLKALEDLDLSNCDSLPYSLPAEIGGLSNLKRLNLSCYKELKTLPAEIGNLKAIEDLDLSICDSLTCLPTGIGDLSNLKRFNLSYCRKLKSLPAEIGNLKALEDLVIDHCHSLTYLPVEIGGLSNLKQLSLSYCRELKALPAELGNLKALEDLDLSYCDSLTCLSTKLRALDNPRCSKPSLDSLSAWIGNLTCLESIHLNGYDISISGPESQIWSILSRLPESVVRISLQTFYIEECKSLCSIRLPRRLRQLDLSDTPLIKSTEGTDDGLEKIEILKLLNKQIELGAVCNYYNHFEKSRLFSLEAEHLLDINECGRVLLTEASVALSVWPIALARANKRLQKYPSRNASALYSLLHGPACASRGSFVEDKT
jgi:Leucine-rich repeat (LRR) protein